jgi:hypothetical protein
MKEKDIFSHTEVFMIDTSDLPSNLEQLSFVDDRKNIVDELIKNAPKELFKHKEYVLKLRQEEKKVLSDRITDIIRVNLNITPSRKGNFGYVRGKVTENATGLWIKFPNEKLAFDAVNVLRKYNYNAVQSGSEINTTLISTPEEVVKEEESLLDKINELKQTENHFLEKVEHIKNKPINESQVSENELLKRIYKRIVDFNLTIIDLRAKPVVKEDGSFGFSTIDESSFMFLMENISIQHDFS